MIKDNKPKVEYDVTDIGKAGFDKNLNKSQYGVPEQAVGQTSRYSSLRNTSGGILGKEATLYLGNSQVYIEPTLPALVIREGTKTKTLIGRRPSGEYGIFTPKEGYSALSAYSGESLVFSSEDPSWKSFNPTNFSYASATTITISNYTGTDFFRVGAPFRCTQGNVVKYFYITGVTDTLLTVSAGNVSSVESAPFTAVATSDFPSPPGFPFTFTFDSTIQMIDASISSFAQPGVFEGTFYMIGNILFANYKRSEFTIPNGVIPYMQEELPIPRNTNFNSTTQGSLTDFNAPNSYSAIVARIVTWPEGLGVLSELTNLVDIFYPIASGFPITWPQDLNFNISYQI